MAIPALIEEAADLAKDYFQDQTPKNSAGAKKEALAPWEEDEEEVAPVSVGFFEQPQGQGRTRCETLALKLPETKSLIIVQGDRVMLSTKDVPSIPKEATSAPIFVSEKSGKRGSRKSLQRSPELPPGTGPPHGGGGGGGGGRNARKAKAKQLQAGGESEEPAAASAKAAPKAPASSAAAPAAKAQAPKAQAAPAAAPPAAASATASSTIDNPEVEKKVKALRKKLRDIAKLKEGDTAKLDPLQREKIATEGDLIQQLAELGAEP
mmetsp:Transcript_74829/g.242985  ORF Transcript_74829/g.242985 Transcript_74829/m.242985 type:complete len:265 (+) Transcript_74829:979-1773(+)